jgi:hypothetical protein
MASFWLWPWLWPWPWWRHFDCDCRYLWLRPWRWLWLAACDRDRDSGCDCDSGSYPAQSHRDRGRDSRVLYKCTFCGQFIPRQYCHRITIEGQFQVFQRVSSSKVVLKTVESCFLALKYYEDGSMYDHKLKHYYYILYIGIMYVGSQA